MRLLRRIVILPLVDHVDQSRQVSHAHRFSQLFERQQVRGQRLPVGKLSGSIAALGVQEIQQTGGAALVGILADVAVLLRNIEIARAIEHDHLVVRAQTLIGVTYIREGLAITWGTESAGGARSMRQIENDRKERDS
jgi:hypothetical protein